MKYKSFISLTTLCSFLIALPISLNAQTDLAVSKVDDVRKLELVANYNLAKMYQEKADFSFYKKDFRNAWLYALEALKLEIPSGEKHLSDALLEKISARAITESLFNGIRFTALLPDPESKIKAISYRLDGKVVVVKDNNVAYLLDPSSNTLISSISSSQPISQIAFSRDGGLIALGMEDSSIEVMDTGSWEQKVLIPPIANAGMPMALAFNHDATLVASGAGYSVSFWDISTGKATAAFSAGGHINSLAFNNDSSVLAIGLDLSKFEIGAMHSLVEYGYAPTLKFWNTQTQNFIEEKGFGFNSTVLNVLYSPNGRQLIVSTTDDEMVPPLANVYIADIGSETPKSRTLIKDVKGDITNITFSPDSEAVAIGLSDSKVRIFNTSSGEEKTSFNNETGDISLAYNVEGTRIASSSKEGGVTFWSISKGKSTKTPDTKEKVKIQSDDASLEVMVVDNAVLLKNNKTGKVSKVVEGRYLTISAVAISPSGDEVAYATKDNNLFIWDTQTETLKAEIKDFLDLSMRWSTYQIQLGNPDINVRTLGAPYGYITSLSYSPNGYVLAAGTTDNTIQIWNAKNSADREFGFPNYGRELKGHTGYVEKLAFNKDSTLLASASYDDTIYVWNISSEKRAGMSVAGSKKQVIQCESVEQLYFDDAGKLQATGITDGIEKSCMPTTLFNDFDPNVVSKALELIWDMPSDEGRQSCGAHYGIDNCSLLTAPNEEDSKFDQLISWLESECAYKDEHLKARCLTAR